MNRKVLPMQPAQAVVRALTANREFCFYTYYVIFNYVAITKGSEEITTRAAAVASSRAQAILANYVRARAARCD